MTVTRSRLASIAAELFAEHGAKKTAAALVEFIRSEKLTIDYELLMKDVARHLKKRNVLNATVCSARELSDELHAQLKDYLRQSESAEEVYIENQIQPELIGGVIIDAPDMYIDWSLQGKLKALKK